MNPLVSVTIISYNQAQYLGDAIESILNQDYPNIELVISDDASTDGSVALIEDYAARYPDKIKAVLSPENKGTGDNRDQSFRACTGKYIALLDSDDLAEPTRISEHVALMEAEADCALCYSNVYIIREGQDHKNELFFSEERIAREGDYKTLLQWDNFIPIAGTMIRRDLLDDDGYHFKFGKTFSEGHLFARVSRQGSIRYIDKVLGGYRRHNSSAMATSSGTRSGVRNRKEKSLKAMYQEFKGDEKLTRYALARLYLDGAINGIKQKDCGKFFAMLPKLIWLLPYTIRAYSDRKKGKYILPGIK